MLYGRNRVNDYGYNQRTPEPLSESTEYLFNTIGNGYLEGFKQALKEGADVNAFDEEGMTPLMSIANAYITSNDQPTLEKMAKLLIQNSSVDINAQSKQPVYEEKQKRDSQGRKVFQYLGREIVCQSGNWYMYCDDESLVKDDEGLPILFTTNPLDLSFTVGPKFKLLTEEYEGVMESVKTGNTEKNTALHVACQVGAKNIVKILLTHPDVKTDIKNYKDRSPLSCIERGSRYIIRLEFQKAQEGKELLAALSNRNIDKAKVLLEKKVSEQALIRDFLEKELTEQDLIGPPALLSKDKKKERERIERSVQDFVRQVSNGQGYIEQIFNPNCWRRDTRGKIQTPFNLIIESCLQSITKDKREVLIKLLKHKNLDFSQIKSTPAIEQDKELKQVIEQAIKEQLTDIISKKGLDDVKKLVEDNCFMNCKIVTDIFERIEHTKSYLNEKFPASAEQPLASTNNIPVDFEGFVRELVGELERTKAQLIEKERELDRIVRERTRGINKISQLERDLAQVKQEKVDQQAQVARLTKENAQLRTQNKSLNDQNEKSLKASAPGKRQSNYAPAFFMLSGALAVGASLAFAYDYPVICAYLTAGALVFLLVGCYLCKTGKRDIGPGGTTDDPQVTRVLLSSPHFVESFYTY